MIIDKEVIDFAVSEIGIMLQKEGYVQYLDRKLTGGNIRIINKNFILIYDQSSIKLLQIDLSLLCEINHIPIQGVSFDGKFLLVGLKEGDKQITNIYSNGILKYSISSFNGIPLELPFILEFIEMTWSQQPMIIGKKSIETNSIIWTFSAKELGAYDDYEGHHEGRINGPIIECNGVLVTGLSTHMVGDGIAKRIGIDVESGIVLWLKAYPALDVPEFRNYKGELLAFGKMFSKVDPHTGEVIEDYFPFKELTGYYHKLLITDEYLFTSTLKTELKQISRKSGKVIWSHTLYANKEAGRRSKTINGNDPLQYADGKLYVLDSEKTLHMLDVARD